MPYKAEPLQDGIRLPYEALWLSEGTWAYVEYYIGTKFILTKGK